MKRKSNYWGCCSLPRIVVFCAWSCLLLGHTSLPFFHNYLLVSKLEPIVLFRDYPRGHHPNLIISSSNYRTSRTGVLAHCNTNRQKKKKMICFRSPFTHTRLQCLLFERHNGHHSSSLGL